MEVSTAKNDAFETNVELSRAWSNLMYIKFGTWKVRRLKLALRWTKQ